MKHIHTDMTIVVMNKLVFIFERIKSLITGFLDPEKTTLFVRYGRFPGFTLKEAPSHSSVNRTVAFRMLLL
jgi:hypothetical protein